MIIKYKSQILPRENKKKAKSVKGISFVVTYQHQLKNLGRIVNQNFYLLNMNEENKKVSSLGPMVSFRSPRKKVVIWIELSYIL